MFTKPLTGASRYIQIKPFFLAISMIFHTFFKKTEITMRWNCISKALHFFFYSRLRSTEVGHENIIAEEILFRGVLRYFLARDTGAITGTLRLNRFDIADSLCCMYLIDRFSQLLRCEVALHFMGTWDISDLTLNCFWSNCYFNYSSAVTYVSWMCLWG